MQECLVNLAKTEDSGPKGGWPQNLDLGQGIQGICSIKLALTLWNRGGSENPGNVFHKVSANFMEQGGVQKSWKPAHNKTYKLHKSPKPKGGVTDLWNANP